VPRTNKERRDRNSISSGEAKRALERAAAPEADPSLSEGMVVLTALFTLGLLSLGAAAVPPARVPWPPLAHSISLHRSNLAMIGLGAIATVLLGLNISVLL
jgi:hypothetical protein